MPTKHEVLREVYGYRSFRGGQEQLIDAVMDGRDVLAVMPTGAGKSICFQIPALMQTGITLVVSPLISLMKDQVESLIQNGVRAAYINSSLTPGQIERALYNARCGMYRLIYVAPERLLTESCVALASSGEISGHCRVCVPATAATCDRRLYRHGDGCCARGYRAFARPARSLCPLDRF